MEIEIKRICVPTDFSDAADYALLYGAGLARKFAAEMHVLHVLQDFVEKMQHPDFTAHGTSVHEYLRQLEKGATEYLARLATRKEWKDLKVEKNYRYGSPAEQICTYARQNGVDLLVLGTHGRTGLKHLLMGSVAERVVRTAPCPVLTVRHPEHELAATTAEVKTPPNAN